MFPLPWRTEVHPGARSAFPFLHFVSYPGDPSPLRQLSDCADFFVFVPQLIPPACADGHSSCSQGLCCYKFATLSITSHQRNANRNHSDMPLLTHQDG